MKTFVVEVFTLSGINYVLPCGFHSAKLAEKYAEKYCEMNPQLVSFYRIIPISVIPISDPI